MKQFNTILELAQATQEKQNSQVQEWDKFSLVDCIDVVLHSRTGLDAEYMHGIKVPGRHHIIIDDVYVNGYVVIEAGTKEQLISEATEEAKRIEASEPKSSDSATQAPTHLGEWQGSTVYHQKDMTINEKIALILAGGDLPNELTPETAIAYMVCENDHLFYGDGSYGNPQAVERFIKYVGESWEEMEADRIEQEEIDARLERIKNDPKIKAEVERKRKNRQRYAERGNVGRSKKSLRLNGLTANLSL